ncbi:PREDICTED: protein FAR1-RELATED SEQUENCE 7 [Ipomoea nil]|uniref:protein FAR1-RELATED SEQUENCE 7 n=1 Tax=Ipomoea nil TaxID=35883 RepID=UPI000900E636|nr:PREDICTED: protein FAR1-RELATED SEQUENCE 7 [Ipomoea nil]XP_019180805.1 PREDICTED: protein FAR1-RELATED SEQUENCE 7 [Ipomoea nil]XP_019180806.1 PREDICTED: protein FAR1-RELATED SEQUENCE 7 [Ipomoea nil]XP_019180808.1 PREDICTED: protein FAR1-RELATED SEQUENCE 7 [Ipomoea nil]
MNREDLGNIMTVRAKPTGSLVLKNNAHHDDEGESRPEPYVGLEFDSAEEAQEFYNLYATKVGFRIRIGQLYRSRVDGSVISRRFVCFKEGFQTNTRVGCPAFIKVQKADSGKWVIASINKEHNHDLELPGEITPARIQRKSLPAPRTTTVLSARTGLRSTDEDGPSGVLDAKRLKREEVGGEPKGEPCKGLEFSSANEAYKFYSSYAANTGFKVRIGQLFRSKLDGSITSRRFVCSKEGHQHPSRVGCGAFMRIQRQESGRWVVDRHQIEHNHDLDRPTDTNRRLSTSVVFKEEASSGLDNLDFIDSNGDLTIVVRGRESKIGSDWYAVLLEYFQTRQAEDMGFFYAVQMCDGRAMNLFWADARCRFSCTQFGDAIVFDTTYRRGSHSVPFASFVGVNHHRQPVLLGCALIADESAESFTWVLQAWLRAMSGRRPVSIIADQDWAVQHSIAQVFPGTHHRFSAWQIVSKEQENLGALLSLNPEFKYEYETCIFQSQTANEFDAAWNVLINKYNLKDNAWLKDMSRMRKSWVPLYIRGTFFAGIPVDGSLKSYFCPMVTPQTPLNEFVLRYEKAIEEGRDEERKEDFNSLNLPTVLHTKDPIEEQCRRLYTTTMFKVFQKELMECYSYVGIKINVEGAISRYLVQKCAPNADERNTVAFNASNLNISCSCRMFEFEGVLCRHALKVFQIMNVRELPSRYILHRWTKSAKYGILRDVDSGGGSQDFRALMLWSLREEANKFIETGATSLERYKLAFEIMQEGNRTLRWQN